LEDLAIVEAVDGGFSLAQVIGIKNLNYAEEEASEYKELLNTIQELADSTVKQNVKN
jgi:hypothetical protein